MLRFLRPPVPSRFERLVRDARTEVQAACDRGEAPEFRDLWSSFKDHFARAQYNKCGYCEALLTTSTGALDHHMPKGALDLLPADHFKHGRERPDTSNVEGRLLDRVCERGYHWAAYLWDNYVLVCDRCNTGWKRCLFPVAEAIRAIPPVGGARETPLLLNPYDAEDPAEHLFFDPFGQVIARGGSARGQATIDTCGLWRPSLVTSRFEKATLAYASIRRLLEAPTKEAEEAVYNEIRRAGALDLPHAGMIRAIFQENTEQPWDMVFGAEDTA